MKKKLLIIILLLFFLILQISIVSASTEKNNNTNLMKNNIDSINIEESDTKYSNSLKHEDFKDNIQKTKMQTKSSLNKVYSNKTKNIGENWTFNIYPEKAFANNPININVEIISSKTVNKGSFNYYFDGKYIGNAVIKNNHSNLTYIIPRNYEGYYWMEFKYVDDKNNEIDVNALKDITVYTNDTIILESNLPENYPLNVNNTIELYLKDLDGNIVNKSGYIDFNISYPTFQIRGFMYNETYIGRYKVNQGICRFNFTLKEEYNWSEETVYFDIYLQFTYKNPSNNRNYTLIHRTTPMFGDEVKMKSLPSKISSGKTIPLQFIARWYFDGYQLYEDSIILLYVNKQYIGSTNFTSQNEVASFKYKIPNNYHGNLNIFAKRVTKSGFNTSQTFSQNIQIVKPTKIQGINITSTSGQKITFNGEVNDKKNNPITKGRIVIKLNDKTIKSDIYLNNSNKFNYTYKIPENFTSKKYKITYIYISNNEYARSEQIKTLSILKKVPKITVNNISAYAGQKILLKGKIKDNMGKPISKGHIFIKINKKTINSKITPNKNGYFRYKYTIPNSLSKKYNITYIYTENNQYKRNQSITTLTIKKQSSKITVNNITNYQNKTARLSINITGVKTKIKATSGNVTIKIRNKQYVKKITKGTTVLNYKIPSSLKAGKYKITIFYSGGKNLYKANTTTFLTVKDNTTIIQSKNIKATRGKTIKISATINDSIGYIKRGNATFKINNETIGSCKIINGSASINYKVPESFHGKYKLQILAKGTYTDVNEIQRKLVID